MTTDIEAYRTEFARQAGKPVFIEQQTSGLTAGQYSQWFDLTPLTKKNVLAAKVKFSYTVSGTPAVVAGADILDVLLGQVQVAASSRTAPRTQTITRKFSEDVEQAALDTNYGYPRAAPSATAGTYTASFYVPIGGPAASLRILLASATNAYSAGTVVINNITVYVVEGDAEQVFAYKENNTPSLGTSLQSLARYLPDDIAPDIVIMEGDAASNITQIYAVDANGRILVTSTDLDVVTDGALALTPRTGKLGSGSVAFLAQKAVLRIFQVAFAAAGTHDIGVLEISGPSSVAPNTAQTTVGTPATKDVGVPNAAGVPVSAKSASGAARMGLFGRKA